MGDKWAASGCAWESESQVGQFGDDGSDVSLQVSTWPILDTPQKGVHLPGIAFTRSICSIFLSHLRVHY